MNIITSRNQIKQRKAMNVNDRIKEAARAGIKVTVIAEKSGVSYYRISSVVNPDKYRGESSFNDKETESINNALDEIRGSF